MLDMKTPNSPLFRLGRKFPVRQDQRIGTKTIRSAGRNTSRTKLLNPAPDD